MEGRLEREGLDGGKGLNGGEAGRREAGRREAGRGQVHSEK